MSALLSFKRENHKGPKPVPVSLGLTMKGVFNPVGGGVGLWWPGLVKILMFFFFFLS